MMLPSPSKLKGTEGFTPTGACRQHPVHRIHCFLGKKIPWNRKEQEMCYGTKNGEEKAKQPEDNQNRDQMKKRSRLTQVIAQKRNSSSGNLLENWIS